MELSPKEMGKYLNQLREKKQLSTREVYNLSKVSNSYLSLVENGQRRASAIVLKKLAPVYGVDYLDLYEKAGYIDLIEDEKKQKYRTDELGNPVTQIDLLGTIKAGYDWIANEEKIGTVDIESSLVGNGQGYFALKVKDDTMASSFIENDILIVKKQNDCQNNEFAVVIVNGAEATLRKIKKPKGGGIILQPLNSAYEPVMYTYQEMKAVPVQIVGVVKQMKRDF